MNFKIATKNAEETESIGETIGASLKGGEVIDLMSDLGGGKTTFVRGLVRGFGSKDRVSSPTFTISKVYKKGTQEIHHFDFYRLQESGLIGYELEDVLGDPNIVVVVEWSDVVAHVLPKERLEIGIAATSETGRSITIDCPDTFDYLVKALKPH